MKEIKLRVPLKGGAKKAAEDFERDRKKEPSDQLVQIISEYGTPAPEKKPSKDEKAVKRHFVEYKRSNL